MTVTPVRPSLACVALAVEDIVARCRGALGEHTPVLAVRDVLTELVADPAALERAVGPVEAGGITPLHNGADLTILRVAWTPGMVLNPHEHRMWAVIAHVRRPGGQLLLPARAGWSRPGRWAGGPAREVLVMGDDVIHSVANSRTEFAVALHVYGGDFFTGERSEWTFDTHEERPRDLANTQRLFEEAQRALARYGVLSSTMIS